MYQRKLDWQNLAACRNKPSNLFFPDDEQPRNRDQYVYGIAVCIHCPVRQQCLDYAMEWEQDQRWRFGVWGGLTPHERWIHEPEWQSKKKW